MSVCERKRSSAERPLTRRMVRARTRTTYSFCFCSIGRLESTARMRAPAASAHAQPCVSPRARLRKAASALERPRDEPGDEPAATVHDTEPAVATKASSHNQVERKKTGHLLIFNHIQVKKKCIY